MHYIKYKKWWDTRTFQQAGQQWIANDEYCPFPEGTHAYYEYWDEQIEYIHNGYTHEGQRMPGLHYLYNNFCPIKDKKKKVKTLPDFWVEDANYFLELEKVLKLGIHKNDDSLDFRPPLWECSKSRQVGASLKNCVPLLYNMCFVPHSQNYIGAYLSDDTEKTCQMFLDYFYHAQKYCEFGKNFITKEKYEYYQVGYMEKVDGETRPGGYQSELRVITWKDNPEKGVGGACDLFLIEEAGLHPYLLTSLGFILPACKDGDYTTGNVLAFGAAGKQGQCDDLDKLHHNPGAYEAWEYDNIWDPESPFKKTGYFVPNYSCRKGHIDTDGNPNPESAIKSRDEKLAKLEKTDYEKYLLQLSQFPNTPTEMFGNKGRKRFTTKVIASHIAFLESHQIYGQAVELIYDEKTKRVNHIFVDEKEKKPIRIYPLPKGMDKEGCVEIFEFPEPEPQAGLYIGGIDSYNQEDSYYSDSLGSVFIYKKVSDLAGEGTHRVVVAEYAGRPKNKYDFYKICAYLAIMYNATLMVENEDQEITPWFYNNKFDHLLADQPDIIRSIIPNSKVMGKRTKGIHAATPLIITAENKIARYIDETLGIIYDEEGKPKGINYGVRRILSLGLLYELLHYVHDNNKNFDRVRTFGWTLLYEEETLLEKPQRVQENTKNFFTNTKRFKKQRLLQPSR